MKKRVRALRMMMTLSIPLQRYQPELERNAPLFIPVPAVSWLRWCRLTQTAIRAARKAAGGH